MQYQPRTHLPLPPPPPKNGDAQSQGEKVNKGILQQNYTKSTRS